MDAIAYPRMMSDVDHTVSDDFNLSQLPLAERLKHHRKQIRAVAFSEGLSGVEAYKKRYPESASIRISINTLAYSPRPKGYQAHLVSVVERWLASDAALAETNKADVERLNARFSTNQFNVANHFSKPLPNEIRQSVGATLSKHGIRVDTSEADTMAKLRRVVKAAKVRQEAKRAFGVIGAISGNILTIGGQCFTIEEHRGRECIRITLDGARNRLRLDVLEAAVAGLAGSAADDPLQSTTISSMGEVAPDDECASFPSKLAPEIGEVAPASFRSPLLDRIAAMKPASTLATPAVPDDVGPLSLC